LLNRSVKRQTAWLKSTWVLTFGNPLPDEQSKQAWDERNHPIPHLIQQYTQKYIEIIVMRLQVKVFRRGPLHGVEEKTSVVGSDERWQVLVADLIRFVQNLQHRRSDR
jgi:hypothetical protein